MISFRNDYQNLVHPKILENINRYSLEVNSGYGLDYHSLNAQKLIKAHLNCDADIHFISGGTITNMLVIAHSLKPYEAVISADSGHINVHETGAIEATGHKIIPVKNSSGKVLPEDVLKVLKTHTDEHMVIPKMIYISNSTEIGSIYSYQELLALRKLCDQYNLYLYLDGARIGAALSSKENDLTLEKIAKLCDIFYIGGTKNGAMIGEAVVVVNQELKSQFRHSIKHNGAMLAKGYLLGIQFETLFSDNLFYEIASSANEMAELLRNELSSANIEIVDGSPTNQVFVYLNQNQVNTLKKKYDFEIWERINEERILIRLVTSFNTSKEDVIRLVDDIKKLF